MSTVIKKIYNLTKVTVDGLYDAAATTITLDAGERAKLPTPNYMLLWWDPSNYSNPYDDPNWELVEVTAHPATNDLTVIRGQETALNGKAASTKNTGGADYEMQLVASAYNWERVRSRCAFRAYSSGQTGITQSSTVLVDFDTESFDLTSDYDATNKKFVAPRAMILQVNAAVQITSLDGDALLDDTLYAYIYAGPTGSLVLKSYVLVHAGVHGGDSLSAHISDILSLSASDEVEIRVRHTAATARNLVSGAEDSFFSGFELHPQ